MWETVWVGRCDSGCLCLNDCVTSGLTVCDHVSICGSGSHCDCDRVDSGVTVSDYDCVCEYDSRCHCVWLCLCKCLWHTPDVTVSV